MISKKKRINLKIQKNTYILGQESLKNWITESHLQSRQRVTGTQEKQFVQRLKSMTDSGDILDQGKGKRKYAAPSVHKEVSLQL